MTKQQVREIMTATIEKYGFEVEQGRTMGNLPGVKRSLGDNRYIGFTFTLRYDWTKSTDENCPVKVEVEGGVCQMGTAGSVEELFKAAEEIKRGAELIAELQSLDLSFVEGRTVE